MKKERQEEIQYIYELLQACIEEEGYEIPKARYADGNRESFIVPLKNKLTESDNLQISIEWNKY